MSILKHKNFIYLIAVPAITYLILGSFGYGNDNDIYHMLTTFSILFNEGKYIPSRYQGCLIPELVIGSFAKLGGSYASNVVVSIFSLVSLLITYKLFLLLWKDRRVCVLATLAVAFNPYYLIASATSMDYIFAFLFFVLGIYLLTNKMNLVAAVSFAAATSSRITYGPISLTFLILFNVFSLRKNEAQTQRREAVISVAVFSLLCVILYIPAFISSEYSLSFLSHGSAVVQGQGWIELIGRFIFKNISLNGLLGTLIILSFLGIIIQELLKQGNRESFLNQTSILKRAALLSLLVIFYNELLFLKLPHEISYLIPILPFLYFTVAEFLGKIPLRVTFLSLILVSNIFYNFFSFELFRISYSSYYPPEPVVASGVKFEPHLAPGVLLENIRTRKVFQEYYYQDEKFLPKDMPH